MFHLLRIWGLRLAFLTFVFHRWQLSFLLGWFIHSRRLRRIPGCTMQAQELAEAGDAVPEAGTVSPHRRRWPQADRPAKSAEAEAADVGDGAGTEVPETGGAALVQHGDWSQADAPGEIEEELERWHFPEGSQGQQSFDFDSGIEANVDLFFGESGK